MLFANRAPFPRADPVWASDDSIRKAAPCFHFVAIQDTNPIHPENNHFGQLYHWWLSCQEKGGPHSRMTEENDQIDTKNIGNSTERFAGFLQFCC